MEFSLVLVALKLKMLYHFHMFLTHMITAVSKTPWTVAYDTAAVQQFSALAEPCIRYSYCTVMLIRWIHLQTLEAYNRVNRIMLLNWV
jgi:hypothetical protein